MWEYIRNRELLIFRKIVSFMNIIDLLYFRSVVKSWTGVSRNYFFYTVLLLFKDFYLFRVYLFSIFSLKVRPQDESVSRKVRRANCDFSSNRKRLWKAVQRKRKCHESRENDLEADRMKLRYENSPRRIIFPH